MFLELFHFRQEAHVISLVELSFFKCKELLADVSPLSDLLGPLFDVDDVCIFDKFIELIQLLLLHLLDLCAQPIEKVDHVSSNLSAQVEILALHQRDLLGREDFS